MLIIGCDFHTRFQQIAMAEDSTGELLLERRLDHESDEAHAFYRNLLGTVRVGIEATGPIHWFERLLAGCPGCRVLHLGLLNFHPSTRARSRGVSSQFRISIFDFPILPPRRPHFQPLSSRTFFHFTAGALDTVFASGFFVSSALPAVRSRPSDLG